MLINASHIRNLEVNNFGSLYGRHTFDSVKEHFILSLATDWVLGNHKLTRRDVWYGQQKVPFSSVCVTLHNPKLFLEDREIVMIERRMYHFRHPSEFLYNHKNVTLSFIKETLNTPYNEELITSLNRITKLFGR